MIIDELLEKYYVLPFKVEYTVDSAVVVDSDNNQIMQFVGSGEWRTLVPITIKNILNSTNTPFEGSNSWSVDEDTLYYKGYRMMEMRGWGWLTRTKRIKQKSATKYQDSIINYIKDTLNGEA